ncbi:hypothetical protein DPMN_165234 [Dreissena polymorpha]|uniref:Uncharacterized protein n=1 Tax=Dreissena polymorpha TaxID=45954 RepID=A0A9D4IWT8_DREPO|nr:hypothetical protein DPMN_165234 [Dreissena polymorpha]
MDVKAGYVVRSRRDTDEDEPAGDRGSTGNDVDHLCSNKKSNILRPFSVDVSHEPVVFQLMGQIVDLYARMAC